jgi:hypothetical protein
MRKITLFKVRHDGKMKRVRVPRFVFTALDVAMVLILVVWLINLIIGG